MSDKSIDKVLLDFFPKSSRIDWKNAAMLEIDKKDPVEFLSWRGKDDILFLPYYDKQDVANLQFLSAFQITPLKNSFSGPRSWINLPAVVVNEEKGANKNSLRHLSNGADGILFDLRKHDNVNLTQLMEKIQWPHCFVSFSLNKSPFLSNLSGYIKSHFDPASISGIIFRETIPPKDDLEFYLNNCNSFKALGLIIPPASPTEEISDALYKGILTCESMAGMSRTQNVFNAICFSLSTGASFLESIAKFKVLRILWYQVAQSYGLVDYKLSDLHIHASSVKGDGQSQPEDLLKGTFEAMSATLGGCDSLTLDAGDADINVMPRLARNVSNILREESFFNKVADPLAGSYAIDSMIDLMAKKSWAAFQLKCQAS